MRKKPIPLPPPSGKRINGGHAIREILFLFNQHPILSLKLADPLPKSGLGVTVARHHLGRQALAQRSDILFEQKNYRIGCASPVVQMLGRSRARRIASTIGWSTVCHDSSKQKGCV